MGWCPGATCPLILAVILGPIVLLFLSVSFATDHWFERWVDRRVLAAGTRDSSAWARVSHSRHRGIFREYYPGNDTAFLFETQFRDSLSDGWCFMEDFAILNAYSANFQSRIHLIRCWLSFFVIGLFAFLVAVIIGLVRCCRRDWKWTVIAGGLAFGTVLFCILSIAFFHGAVYMEQNKIADTNYFYQTWDSNMRSATSSAYGYSYILGWVGIILALIVAVLYLLDALFLRREYNKQLRKKGMYRRNVTENPYNEGLETDKPRIVYPEDGTYVQPYVKQPPSNALSTSNQAQPYIIVHHRYE